jgi:hypothetical protein
MSTLRRLRAPLLILAAYAALTVVFTWPLAANFASHVPGDGSDDPALAWNLWWVKYALLDLHVSPLITGYMFYPVGINLSYFTLTLLNGIAAIPLQALFGLITTANLITVGYFILAGFGAYILAMDVLDEATSELGATRPIAHAAAFLAGVIFAFAPSRFLFAGFGQFNVLSTAWVPFYVWSLRRMIRQPGPRWAVTTGVFLLLNGLAEYTYASFVLIFTAIYLIYLWFADRALIFAPSTRTADVSSAPPTRVVHRFMAWLSCWNGRLAASFGVAGMIFLIGFSPVLYQMLRELQIEGDYMMAGWGFADAFSADLLGFFVPSVLNPVLGDWAKGFHFTYTNFATIGYAALILAVLAGLVSKRLRFWAWSALAFLIIMLGPLLHVNGQYVFDLDGLAMRLPLPFIIFHYIPFIKGNRYPSRYTVMLGLCVAMLAAWGAAWLMARMRAWLSAGGARPRRGAWAAALSCVAILSLIGFDSLSVPLPLSDLRAPAVYEQIRQEAGDFTVLELPLGWRNGFRVTGALNTAIMYEQFYQATSQKRMLGGNTSRNPEFKFDYFIQAPLIRSFIALEEKRALPPSTEETDRRLAADVLSFFNIRYVIVHPPYTGSDLEAYAIRILPMDLIYDQAGVRAYRVTLPPGSGAPGGMNIDLASDLGRLSVGEGWSQPEGAYRWAQRQDARLFLPLEAGRAYRLTLRAMAPQAGQRISASLNGVPVGNASLSAASAAWQSVAFDLPASAVRQGLNELTFTYDRPLPLLAGQPIGKTGSLAPVNVVVRSAGQEAGDYAHIYVNGSDVTANRRGYNLAVINPQTGVVEQTAAFDTFADAKESNRMAELINKLPAGRIVALAVRDEASMSLQQDAVDALSSLGATVDLRSKFRWGQAIIGVRGSPPGTALEAASRDAPVQVYVGRNSTTGQVGFALESVTAIPLP